MQPCGQQLPSLVNDPRSGGIIRCIILLIRCATRLPNSNAEMDQLTFRILTDDDCDVVVRFLQKNFIPFEPLCVAAKVDAVEEKAFPYVIIKNSLWQGVSIGVFDNKNGQMCAVRINMLAKNEKSLPLTDEDDKHSEKQQMVHRVLSAVKGSNMIELLGTNDYMEHIFVTVSKDYARRGIASELYRRSEALAAKHECKKMFGTCSNYYTKLSTSKSGYKTVKELRYEEYVDEVTGSKPYAGIEAPHKTISLVVKDVDPAYSNYSV